MSNTTKMTNARALTYVLENCSVPADVGEKLTKMLEQTQKKNTAGRKPTAVQVANEEYKTAILEGMEDGVLYTITDLMKEIPVISADGLSNQRVSAIVRQMVGTSITRTEDKRKAYFSKIGERV